MWHRHPAERVLFTESLHDVLLQAMNRRAAHVKETKRKNKHEVKLSRNFTSGPTSSFSTLLVFSSDYAQRAVVKQIQFALISFPFPLSLNNNSQVEFASRNSLFDRLEAFHCFHSPGSVR